jgi:hypothetical protein
MSVKSVWPFGDDKTPERSAFRRCVECAPAAALLRAPSTTVPAPAILTDSRLIGRRVRALGNKAILDLGGDAAAHPVSALARSRQTPAVTPGRHARPAAGTRRCAARLDVAALVSSRKCASPCRGRAEPVGDLCWGQSAPGSVPLVAPWPRSHQGAGADKPKRGQGLSCAATAAGDQLMNTMANCGFSPWG